MSHVDSCLRLEEKHLFDSLVHLFVTHNLVDLNDQKMLKSLNFLIVRCVAEQSRRVETVDRKNNVLEHEVSLCHGEFFMLM